MLAGSGLAFAQSTLRANVTAEGWPAWAPATEVELTADGRELVLSSAANLTPNVPTPYGQVYVYSRSTGAVTCVSVAQDGSPADFGAGRPACSADGRFVVFASIGANLVSGDSNATFDAFVHDRVANVTECASRANSGAFGTDASFPTGVSNDGRFVALESWSSNFDASDGNGVLDVYVRDRTTGTIELASRALSGGAGTFQSFGGGISGDGRHVVFESDAFDLVPGDTNALADVFVFDRALGVTTRVSVTAAGGQVGGASHSACISNDGRYVGFVSLAPELVPGDTNGLADAFVHDLQTGQIERVSVGPGGVEADGETLAVGLSGDGRFAAFTSAARNLSVPLDVGNELDVFVRDLATGTNWLASRGPLGGSANGACFHPRVSDDGQSAAFASDATNLVSGDANGVRDVFLASVGNVGSVVTYGTPKTSSANCASFVSVAGYPRATGDDACFVVANDVLEKRWGFFFWSRAPANLPFAGGTLLVQAPFVRTNARLADSGTAIGACSGHLSFHFSQSYMASENVLPGDVLFGQFWYRDSGFLPPDNLGLSDGVRLVIGP